MNTSARPKRPANLTLDQDLVAEAKDLGINLSNAAEHGLRLAVAQIKAERWKKENAAALKSSNDWVEQNGIPLRRFRRF